MISTIPFKCETITSIAAKMPKPCSGIYQLYLLVLVHIGAHIVGTIPTVLVHADGFLFFFEAVSFNTYQQYWYHTILMEK